MDDFDRQHKIEAFQERVRARLAAMNCNGADIAKQLGITRQTWSNRIKRGPYLQFRSLEQIAKVLDVSVAWLIDGEPRDAFKSKDELPEDSIDPLSSF